MFPPLFLLQFTHQRSILFFNAFALTSLSLSWFLCPLFHSPSRFWTYFLFIPQLFFFSSLSPISVSSTPIFIYLVPSFLQIHFITSSSFCHLRCPSFLFFPRFQWSHQFLVNPPFLFLSCWISSFRSALFLFYFLSFCRLLISVISSKFSAPSSIHCYSFSCLSSCLVNFRFYSFVRVPFLASNLSRCWCFSSATFSVSTHIKTESMLIVHWGVIKFSRWSITFSILLKKW